MIRVIVWLILMLLAGGIMAQQAPFIFNATHCAEIGNAKSNHKEVYQMYFFDDYNVTSDKWGVSIPVNESIELYTDGSTVRKYKTDLAIYHIVTMVKEEQLVNVMFIKTKSFNQVCFESKKHLIKYIKLEAYNE